MDYIELAKTTILNYKELNSKNNKKELNKDSSLPAPDEEKILDTIRISAQKGSAKVVEKITELTKAIPFSNDSTKGNIKADLSIGVVDKNGFLDYGNEDLNVTLNGNIKIKKDIFHNSLKSIENLKVKRSWYADVDIGKVTFDSKNKIYKIQIKVDGIGLLNDDIYLVIKPDKNKNFTMSVEDKWIPNFIYSDKDILNKAKKAIMDKLNKSNFGLEAKLEGDKLYFIPQIKKQEIPLKDKDSLRINKTNIDFNNTKFNIDNEGNIDINLKNVMVTASHIGKDKNNKLIKQKTSGDIDFAQMNISADINTNGNKEIVVKRGKISTRIDEKEAERIKIDEHNFNKHFNGVNLQVENLTGKISIDKDNKVASNAMAKVSLSLIHPDRNIKLDGNIGIKFNSKGDFQIASKDLTITHPDGKNQVEELLIADDKDGLQFHIKEQEKDLPPLDVKTTKNDLKILIGAQNYFEKLLQTVGKAKESINIECYLFSGNVAETLTDSLLLKAGGVSENKGKLKLTDNDGVKIKLIFDSLTGDETPETHSSMIMIKNKYNKFIQDVKAGNGKFVSLSLEEQEKVIANVYENMKWKLLKGGLPKIDHRKVIIIDSQNALSGGGVNLTDSAMKKHDMMVDIWGPAVNRIQTEFLQNWEEIAGKIPENEKKLLVKDESTLAKLMRKHQKITGIAQTSNTQVLVTDDNQFQTYQKMIEQIRNAKSEINIEHAYFTDKKIIEEVANAIRRGVAVNVILPQESDEGDKLHYGNLGTLQILKKASEEPGAGKFNAYLYRKDVKFNHTKAMAFDGKTAIVGSTNLTTRSLRGTFTGFLYNREMSLFVDDKKFVAKLNKDLFLTDTKPEKAIKLDEQWFKNLTKEQKKIDKYMAMQSLF